MTGLYCDSTRHRLDACTKYRRRRCFHGARQQGAQGCPGDHSPGTAGHAPVILSLQKLEFLFNSVERLRNSELEGLACSLMRRLRAIGDGDRGSGMWVDG